MPGTGSRSLGAPEQQEPEQPEDVHNAEAEADPREPILDAKRASKESAEHSERKSFAVSGGADRPTNEQENLSEPDHTAPRGAAPYLEPRLTPRCPSPAPPCFKNISPRAAFTAVGLPQPQKDFALAMKASDEQFQLVDTSGQLKYSFHPAISRVRECPFCLCLTHGRILRSENIR